MWSYTTNYNKFISSFLAGNEEIVFYTVNTVIEVPITLPQNIRGIVIVNRDNPTVHIIGLLINTEAKTYHASPGYEHKNNLAALLQGYTSDPIGCSCCPEKIACKSYIKKRVIKDASDLPCTSELLQRSNAKNNVATNAIEFTKVAYNATLCHLKKYNEDIWECDLEIRKGGAYDPV